MLLDIKQIRHATVSGWLGAVLATALPATADVVINEFMASNATTLTNATGATDDWIEFYNPTATNLDLGGWHLTDNPDNLTKWTFPGATVVPAFGYRLVYASAPEVPPAGPELHADFKLDAAGEYLALIKPDGVTVASSFAPRYPAQRTDVSFGLRPDSVTTQLVGSNALCRYKVPVDGSDGTNWWRAGFDDSAWGAGPFGIGYESTPGEFAGLIQTPLPNRTPGAYVRCRFEIANPALLDSLLLRVKFDDGFAAYLNGVRVASANDPLGLTWSSAATLEQTNSEAVLYADFDLSAHRSALVDGTNLLAIQLLNKLPSPLLPSDALLAVELSATAFTPSPSGTWRYFHEPTPGARNVLGLLDLVQPVAFSVPRGFPEAPFALALTNATPGAAIYYTLDSSVPTTNAGIRYVGPIAINRTRVVRARAFKANEEPSVVMTHTYLFPADIIAAPSMRTTITQHPVYGPQMTNALRALPSICLATLSTTIEYAPELPASVELIWPDGSSGFQVDAGVARFGNYWIRGGQYAKRMFRLYFRQRYGAGKLRYPLFEGFERGLAPVEEFDQLDLKSGSQDMADRGFYMSEPFCDDAMLEMGQLAPHGRFVHVYLNGQYWGVYHLHERWEPNMLAAYLGGDAGEYESVDSEGTTENWTDEPVHPVDGDGSAWLRIESLRTNYHALHPYLDVTQYLDFMLMWFAGYSEAEFRGVGPVAANAGGYKMWLKDADGYLRGLGHLLTTPGPGGVFSGLRQEQHPDYLMLERDRIHRHFFGEGALTPDRNRARLIRRCDELEPAFPAESARWGYRTPDTWAAEKAAALARMVTQTDQVLANFRGAGWYPLDAPAISPAGGVFTGSVVVTMSVATNGAAVYYTLDGADPREAGSGAIAGQPYLAPLALTRTTLVKARARSGNTWGALQETLYVPVEPSPLRLTELMYHPRAPDAAQTNLTASDFEYVELRNTGAATIGLAGVRFTDGITFDFTQSDVQALAPGAHVLVVKNRAAFAARYPNVPAARIAGAFAAVANWPVQALADGGEQLRLVDGLDRTIVDFTYGDGRSWPLAADGAGHALVPLALDNQSDALEYGGNWRASTFRDGSPGAADPAPIRDVVVNEITAHTDYTNAALPEYDSNDWLELFNVTTAPIGLGDWYLSDRADNLKLWSIPATSIVTAGGWIVLDEVQGFHNPITNGFGLSKLGDQVFLSYLPGDARDRVADAARFDGQDNGLGFGRYPDGEEFWFEMALSPGAANFAPTEAVTISEFMFHPPDSNGVGNIGAEFIELYNPLSVTANLWTVDGAWKLAGEVEWAFSFGTSLGPGERLVLVSFDPVSNATAYAAFLATYGVTNGQIRLQGPYRTSLSDRGGRLVLEAPLASNVPGEPMVWVAVDDIIYFDRAPWPAGADGTGRALARVEVRGAGRDPQNWYAAPPTPGWAPERISLTAPEADAIVFAPGPLTLRAVVDAAQVAAPLVQVTFTEGAQVLGVLTGKPYAMDWTLPGAGHHALQAEVTDAAGTWTSRTVHVTALAVSTVLVEVATDGQAIFRGQLDGDVPAEVRVYWGLTDGGRQPMEWEQAALIGMVSNAAFAVTIQDLEPNRLYHVRASARVGSHLGWAPASVAFTAPGYAQWPFSARIRFDGYAESEALQDFPVLVHFGSHLDGFDYAQFNGDASSLRFTDDSGEQRLAFEWDTYNSNGLSTVWVRLPTLTNGAAIRAYWGLSGVTSAPPAAADGGVWKNGFGAVWHLGESLANAAQAGSEASNAGATLRAGMVGQARAFDGIDDWIDPMIPAAWFSQHLAAQTWSLWVCPSNATITGATLFGADGGTNRLYLTLNRTPLVRKWVYGVGANERQSAPYVMDNWQMLAMVLSNGVLYAQMNDGVLNALGAYTPFVMTNQPTMGRRGGAGSFFAGALDEVRVAPAVRSAAWLRTEYRTVATPFAFAAYEPVRHVDESDADGDGLPDAWERVFFGDTTGGGGGDADGDGMSDAGEFIAGTDPTNAASIFRLDITANPVTLEVALPMQAVRGTGYERQTRYYDLLAAPTLDAGAWSFVPDFTNLLGEDRLIFYTNTGPSPGSRFFRSRVRLEPTGP